MPYASSQTADTIINLTKRFFYNNQQFKNLGLLNQDYFDLINEAMEEIYQECGYQLDEFSINTVVGTCEYPIDGTENNFPNEIDLIFRVDYDGSPLSYQYKYPTEFIAPTSDDSNDTPDGWYEKWDGGKRYLGLSAKPDAVVVLKVFSSRIPALISLTTGVPALHVDFYSLIKKIVIRKVYVRMEQLENAKGYEILERIAENKAALKQTNKDRSGKRVTKIAVMGIHDIFS